MYFKIDLTLMIGLHEEKACEVLNPFIVIMVNEGFDKFFLIDLKVAVILVL